MAFEDGSSRLELRRLLNTQQPPDATQNLPNSHHVIVETMIEPHPPPRPYKSFFYRYLVTMFKFV